MAAPAAPTGDWLMVHAMRDEATMAILRGPNLVFFRNHVAEGENSLADMVHQTAMYYEDRLSGTGFSHVLLAGAGAGSAQAAAIDGPRLSIASAPTKPRIATITIARTTVPYGRWRSVGSVHAPRASLS